MNEESVFAYADDGKIDSITYNDETGNVSSKEVFRYGANGDVTEITTYGADNKTSQRMLVKYDAKGNISKITTYAVSKKFGTTTNEMAGMVDFAYTYSNASVLDAK